MITKNEDFVAVDGKVYLIDTSGGNITITLPLANTISVNSGFRFVNAGVNSIIYAPQAGENINGVADYTNATQYQVDTFHTDGTHWYRFS